MDDLELDDLLEALDSFKNEMLDVYKKIEKKSEENLKSVKFDLQAHFHSKFDELSGRICSKMDSFQKQILSLERQVSATIHMAEDKIKSLKVHHSIIADYNSYKQHFYEMQLRLSALELKLNTEIANVKEVF